ncbi:MAG: glycosyltransferase, partial [Halodesulfurarchaeum sp.]
MAVLAWVALALTVVLVVPYLLYGLLYLAIQPAGSPAEKRDQEPPISIVLPTYNEADIIDRKLEDILDLEYPAEKLELVVVDSSEDDTRERIRSFFEDRANPTLQLLEEDERRGLAPALNDAYAAASNEIVVKTDCDSLLAADALRVAAANLADPDVGAVTGRNAEVLGESEVEAGYRGVQSHIQQLESHLDSTLIFHGPFSAFRNESIVPIDPNSLADDTELALKIRRGGERVIFDPAIRYMEASHSDFIKRRKQKDRRGMGLIRLLVQHRDALGRYGKYGRVVLPFNWWFMLVSPALLAVALLGWIGAGFQLFGLAGLVLPI